MSIDQFKHLIPDKQLNPVFEKADKQCDHCREYFPEIKNVFDYNMCQDCESEFDEVFDMFTLEGTEKALKISSYFTSKMSTDHKLLVAYHILADIEFKYNKVEEIKTALEAIEEARNKGEYHA